MVGPESTSWLNDPALLSGCDGTPEVYGVTVYKMGLCTDDPFDAISPLATAGGLTPVYDSCSWTYVNDSGEYREFSSTTTATLSSGTSSVPVAGSYPYAVIILEPVFKIQDSYGPILPLTTSSSAVTYVSSAASVDALPQVQQKLDQRMSSLLWVSLVISVVQMEKKFVMLQMKQIQLLVKELLQVG